MIFHSYRHKHQEDCQVNRSIFSTVVRLLKPLLCGNGAIVHYCVLTCVGVHIWHFVSFSDAVCMYFTRLKSGLMALKVFVYNSRMILVMGQLNRFMLKSNS